VTARAWRQPIEEDFRPRADSRLLELVINLKTVKALGVDLPPSFYWRADELIK
jgi:hypothetical protein